MSHLGEQARTVAEVKKIGTGLEATGTKVNINKSVVSDLAQGLTLFFIEKCGHTMQQRRQLSKLHH